MTALKGNLFAPLSGEELLNQASTVVKSMLPESKPRGIDAQPLGFVLKDTSMEGTSQNKDQEKEQRRRRSEEREALELGAQEGEQRQKGKSAERFVEEEGDEGVLYAQKKEQRDWRGKADHRFMGKPRELMHQYDRKPGTGLGREHGRELPKGGNGKGNWGTIKNEIDAQLEAAEVPRATEKLEEVAPEIKEEADESKKTLDEYMQLKKKPSIKKEPRKVEEIQEAYLEKFDSHKEKTETLSSSLKNQEIYNVGNSISENAELLGFLAEEEQQPRKGLKQTQKKGLFGLQKGEKLKQLDLNPEAFPAL